MKTRHLLILLSFAALGFALEATSAEPATIKVWVDYPDPPVPEVQFALFSIPNLTDSNMVQVTPWTTNAFAFVSATNSSAFFAMAGTNFLTKEPLGFSKLRFIPLRLKLDLLLNAKLEPKPEP